MRRNILVLAAHPDDETIGCGGTLARHAANKDRVSVVWFTDGVGSRGPADDSIRRREAERAVRLLGVSAWDWIDSDYEDQLLDTVPLLQLSRQVCEVVDRYKPSTIYTHWPHDLNQDHRAVAQATLIATRPWTLEWSVRVLAYEVPESTGQAFGQTPFRPNTFVDIGQQVDIKCRALEAYASEHCEPPHPRSEIMLRAQAAVHGSMAGVAYAEAFALLRETCR